MHSTQDSKFSLAPRRCRRYHRACANWVEFSRTEYRTCAVFLMQDRDIQRVYRLCDFNKAQFIPPDQAYGNTGNVNSAGRLNLVIESGRPDTQHIRDSIDPAHADGAGGLPTD